MDDVSDGGSVPPPPTIRTARTDTDSIRIMLATDNHTGYRERDHVRGLSCIQDPDNSQAVFIFLADDHFHEIRPARGCLYSGMALLHEHTLGDKPVELELLSDPYEGKADGYSFPAVNYEDPNFNVAIPVFSVHGNHDDPQGAGSEVVLGALDMLSVSGLMNYIGKFGLPLTDADAQTTGIAIRPVLLRKGTTHLGLYGVGSVKDARMHFELRSNRTRTYMPKNKVVWFNVTHPPESVRSLCERVTHGPQESVPEGMFDDSVDIVIWGHEHDCRIIPELVAGKKYVATSLADGESLENFRDTLLTIQNKEFDLIPIPLRTVRPFVLEEVDLMEMEITKLLKARINTLIDKANEQWDERNAKAVMDGEEALERMLPLIRLKVDTTGVSEMSNPIRFGQEFTGRIANPRDVRVFHRAKKASKSSKVIIDQPELNIDDPNLTLSEKPAKVRVATLVKEYLAAQELQLLGEADKRHINIHIDTISMPYVLYRGLIHNGITRDVALEAARCSHERCGDRRAGGVKSIQNTRGLTTGTLLDLQRRNCVSWRHLIPTMQLLRGWVLHFICAVSSRHDE
ncbi:hypothetical protein FIBSPDRAFT_915052 [Athelia psychrophila]|uniref:Mre11 DNA-binding domain-containing protein n=1 Tax=Athelia psychrophila TaxID=1759441 RepID=A0A167V375_9AGAM|nr:hypothetical protein FIBSPDRAFT_915052 [Fibularhizoctonia sp. CBS 109695]